MREEWREINDYPLYDVSNRGRVRSWNNSGWGRRDEPIMLSPATVKGYQKVVLCNDDGKRMLFIHVLVLEAFVGPCPKGMESRHLDNDRSNNDVGNLEWTTHVVNIADKVHHGTALSGRDVPGAVEPSSEDVTEIKRRYDDGEAPYSIARDFPDLSYGIVRRIAYGTHWSVRDD